MNDYSHVEVTNIWETRQRHTCAKCGETLPRKCFPILWRRHVAKKPLLFKAINIQSSMCSGCHRERFEAIKQHPLYAVPIHKFCRKKLGNVMQGAASRELDCLVTEVDLLAKLFEQKGRCALSGVLMTYEAGFRRRSNTLASLDRIDSSHPYAPNNIQWLCAAVNVMKNDLQQTDFLNWCKKIVAHRIDQEEGLLKAMS